MSKRFAWLAGVVVLVLFGLLVACGSNYNSASNGLVLVGSQGSGLIETFSFDLASGSVSAISNSPNDTSTEVCVLNGLPTSIVMDPAGAYAYAILNANSLCPGSATGIQAFKVNSDGSTKAVGSLVPDPNPVVMTRDAAGKFLFVAEGLQGIVNVYAIGSNAALTLVPGTFTFTLPAGFRAPNFVAVAATPTVFPSIGLNGIQNSVCSAPGTPPPTSEYLYAVDSVNYVVWEFAVNTSSGALGNPGTSSAIPYFLTDAVPAGVAVDPCNRFVYVSDSQTNKVSAYTMCNGSSTAPLICTTPGSTLAPGSLVPVSGSPFSLAGGANGPGPLVVDPYGNSLYVLETLSNQISTFRISPVSGSLAPTNPQTVATGTLPISIAIRADDSWLFVTNFNPPSISQYSITPASGGLSSLPATTTDNYPWGLAVK